MKPALSSCCGHNRWRGAKPSCARHQVKPRKNRSHSHRRQSSHGVTARILTNSGQQAFTPAAAATGVREQTQRQSEKRSETHCHTQRLAFFASLCSMLTRPQPLPPSLSSPTSPRCVSRSSSHHFGAQGPSYGAQEEEEKPWHPSASIAFVFLSGLLDAAGVGRRLLWPSRSTALTARGWTGLCVSPFHLHCHDHDGSEGNSAPTPARAGREPGGPGSVQQQSSISCVHRQLSENTAHE